MQNKKNVRSNLPAGHFSQELLPSKTLNSPTSQALHSCVPGTWAYLPFGHMEQAAEALWEECPGGQSVQLEAMVETENLPLLQSRHSGRPGFGAFLPGTQSRQSVRAQSSFLAASGAVYGARQSILESIRYFRFKCSCISD